MTVAQGYTPPKTVKTQQKGPVACGRAGGFSPFGSRKKKKEVPRPSDNSR